MHPCPHDAKYAASKGLVRTVMEYGSSVWDPQAAAIQHGKVR